MLLTIFSIYFIVFSKQFFSKVFIQINNKRVSDKGTTPNHSLFSRSIILLIIGDIMKKTNQIWKIVSQNLVNKFLLIYTISYVILQCFFKSFIKIFIDKVYFLCLLYYNVQYCIELDNLHYFLLVVVQILLIFLALLDDILNQIFDS